MVQQQRPLHVPVSFNEGGFFQQENAYRPFDLRDQFRVRGFRHKLNVRLLGPRLIRRTRSADQRAESIQIRRHPGDTPVVAQASEFVAKFRSVHENLGGLSNRIER